MLVSLPCFTFTGPGWSSWADVRLHPRADGAEYVGPDGQRVLFPRMGEGYGRVLGPYPYATLTIVETAPRAGRRAAAGAVRVGPT